ncbi:MAG: hypothetical protein LBR91_03630 [Puniceicoccales bacterium]|nr:hypothetical protein [Puniceicoccales bacterium]
MKKLVLMFIVFATVGVSAYDAIDSSMPEFLWLQCMYSPQPKDSRSAAKMIRSRAINFDKRLRNNDESSNFCCSYGVIVSRTGTVYESHKGSPYARVWTNGHFNRFSHAPDTRLPGIRTQSDAWHAMYRSAPPKHERLPKVQFGDEGGLGSSRSNGGQSEFKAYFHFEM